MDRRRSDAQVAQLVEHATENRSVGGSIPPLGTISPESEFDGRANLIALPRLGVHCSILLS